jgi:hypothetical protein
VTGRNPNNILGQIVSPLGFHVGNQIPIAISAVAAAAPNGQAAYNSNADECFATWRDQAEENLKGQRISADGNLIGNPIVISSSFPESSNPTASVAFDPKNDRYLVVFAVFQEPQVWGQFVSNSGVLLGDNFPILTLNSRETPSIVYSSLQNSYLIVWRNDNNIFARLLSATGAAIGNIIPITRTGTAREHLRAVANSRTGEFLIVWPDYRNTENIGLQDIFGQLVRIRQESGVLTVVLDVRPGSPENTINPKSQGVIPVAILSTNAFDASTLDPRNVRFGPNRALATGKAQLDDVNGDGQSDILLHFRTQESGIQCGDTSVSITGETVDGIPIQGSDAIRTVGCKPTQKPADREVRHHGRGVQAEAEQGYQIGVIMTELAKGKPVSLEELIVSTSQ